MGVTLQIVRGTQDGNWYLYEHDGLWHGVTNPGELCGLGWFGDPEARTADLIRAAGQDPDQVAAVQSALDEGSCRREQLVTFEAPDDGIVRPEPLDLYGQGLPDPG